MTLIYKTLSLFTHIKCGVCHLKSFNNPCASVFYLDTPQYSVLTRIYAVEAST